VGVAGDNAAMARVFLGLGSNLGDRTRNLIRAIEAIASLPGVALCAQAEAIETPPMGAVEQGAYLNTVIEIETAHTPRGLLDRLQQIELDLGRAAKQDRVHWGPRVIDIDILLFGGGQMDEPGLMIPHPGMHERLFVLQPLASIAPEAHHPALGKTASQLLDAMSAKMTHASKKPSGGAS